MDRRNALKLFGLTLLSFKMLGNTQALASMAGLSPESAAEVVKGSRIMMGNIPVTITAISSDRARAKEAIAMAFTEGERLEKLMSVFKPESEFSKINSAAGIRPVTVSPEVLEVIQKGLEVTRQTGGAFNLAMGPAIQLWDFMDQQHVPTKTELEGLKTVSNPKDIQVDKNSNQVFLRRKGMRIDPGGIGKGYMAEHLKRKLKEAGITSGIIAAAGDLVFFGKKPDEKPWHIGIQHPRKSKEMVASIDLTDCAVSTSGDYERFFKKDGVIYHHLLDPKTLFPARDCQSVTVISKDGLWADSLSTGVFVMGPKKGMEFLEQSEMGKGMIIDSRGGVSVSRSLEKQVQLL